jgi:polyphosphate kinase
LVTKYNLKRRFKKLIKKEIINMKLGEKAQIIVKVNNLDDQDMIDSLYEAAEAGVELTLIVRSICCFKPKKSFEKNVQLIRLVDSYLEHSRVFYFHDAGKEHVYLSSADWMQRNLYHRIENAFPIKNKRLKSFVKEMLKLQIKDNTKAVEINEELVNIPRQYEGKIVRSQYDMYALIDEYQLRPAANGH